MKISAGTDIGRLRGSNQDAYRTGELPCGGAWAVVCDGMGGHAGGNVASETAAGVIAASIEDSFRENMNAKSVRNLLETAIAAANAEVFDKAAENSELFGMGTTVVAAVCFNGQGVVANVGDSRCYRISDGKLSCVTKDHSLVQELVDAGLITKEEAKNHPRRNIITRAVGTDTSVSPDFSDVSFDKGDMLLLCSDGLTNHVGEEDILSCTSDGSVADYSGRLISLANERGGSDNITAVVIVG